ncbi:hypothetical protein CMI47_16660 [Candidatus Pacearchaeota archaeon]|nr:hypothetical protein [Candidatus Pacearchaeota archaeon]|tara:strand:- start:2 stop:193 length:192 start_codon:yes stop_codon:yes gene_type:complete
MVLEETVGDLVTQVGQIGIWLRTVGIIFVIWVIFDIINLIMNRRRIKILKRIDMKVDKLLKKK